MPTNTAVERTKNYVSILESLGLRRRVRSRLPRQLAPSALERAYGRSLVQLLKSFDLDWAQLLSELPTLVAASRLDAWEFDRVRSFVAGVKAKIKTVVEASTRRIASTYAVATARFNQTQLGRQTKAALGFEIPFSDRSVASRLGRFVETNVGLIQGLTERTASEIEALILDGFQNRSSAITIGAQVRRKLRTSQKRAVLVARDQLHKLYGQVNAARQQELGVRKFVWRTMHDERVRTTHRSRDGKAYSYENPRGADGELPGEPILCRCIAEPVFTDS